MRPYADADAEIALALMNERLSPDLPTVLLVTSAKNVYLSSTFVREDRDAGRHDRAGRGSAPRRRGAAQAVRARQHRKLGRWHWNHPSLASLVGPGRVRSREWPIDARSGPWWTAARCHAAGAVGRLDQRRFRPRGSPDRAGQAGDWRSQGRFHRRRQAGGHRRRHRHCRRAARGHLGVDGLHLVLQLARRVDHPAIPVTSQAIGLVLGAIIGVVAGFWIG